MKKKIIITGSSRGIGQAICQKLVNEEHHVIGISRNHTLSQSNFYTPINFDLSNLDQLPEFLKKLEKEHENVDVIICNAGRGHFGSLEEFSYEDIRSLLELNFLSQVFLIKAFLPQMKKRQKGHIIFIGSEAALAGKKKGSIYCASKFALRGFAQALREECATQNIGVSIVNPGMVKTDFFDHLTFKPGDENQEHLLPHDVADVVTLILNSRQGTVFDEINLSPQTKKIVKK